MVNPTEHKAALQSSSSELQRDKNELTREVGRPDKVEDKSELKQADSESEGDREAEVAYALQPLRPVGTLEARVPAVRQQHQRVDVDEHGNPIMYYRALDEHNFGNT